MSSYEIYHVNLTLMTHEIKVLCQPVTSFASLQIWNDLEPCQYASLHGQTKPLARDREHFEDFEQLEGTKQRNLD